MNELTEDKIHFCSFDMCADEKDIVFAADEFIKTIGQEWKK